MTIAKLWPIFFIGLAIGKTPEQPAKEGFFFEPLLAREVRFDYCLPTPMPAKATVLLLVPPYNGSGLAMFSPAWRVFANATGIVLLAPTFQTSPDELRAGEGYYYPWLGSGKTVEKALAVLKTRADVQTKQILIFGFSAGAHFAHRFALWKPERVKAFVAGAAGWWQEPTLVLARVPALILCGEDDSRLRASQEFFQKGLVLGLPWLWRSYQGIGHAVSPAMLEMAQAFLAEQMRPSQGVAYYGDTQTYEVTVEQEKIPEAVRVRLQSRALADIWKKEK